MEIPRHELLRRGLLPDPDAAMNNLYALTPTRRHPLLLLYEQAIRQLGDQVDQLEVALDETQREVRRLDGQNMRMANLLRFIRECHDTDVDVSDELGLELIGYALDGVR